MSLPRKQVLNRQEGTKIMRWDSLVAQTKIPFNMAAPGTEHKVQKLGGEHVTTKPQ